MITCPLRLLFHHAFPGADACVERRVGYFTSPAIKVHVGKAKYLPGGSAQVGSIEESIGGNVELRERSEVEEPRERSADDLATSVDEEALRLRHQICVSRGLPHQRSRLRDL